MGSREGESASSSPIAAPEPAVGTHTSIPLPSPGRHDTHLPEAPDQFSRQIPPAPPRSGVASTGLSDWLMVGRGRDARRALLRIPKRQFQLRGGANGSPTS
jgi:hypothetical protein